MKTVNPQSLTVNYKIIINYQYTMANKEQFIKDIEKGYTFIIQVYEHIM